MSSSRRNRLAQRGQPLLALALLLGGWVVVRAALWQEMPALEQPANGDVHLPASSQTLAVPNTVDGEPNSWEDNLLGQPWLIPPTAPEIQHPDVRFTPTWPSFGDDPQTSETGHSARNPASARRVVGHNLLLMAGLSNMPFAATLLPYLQGSAASPARPAAAPAPAPPRPAFVPAVAAGFVAETARAAAASPSRWMTDAWALLRGSDNSPNSATLPSYGRSQIGAVLRYRLAPGSANDPQAHLRATAALAGDRDEEAALGLSARPLARVPVRITAEARLRDTDTGQEARAAAYAVSEFPPLALPGRVTGEAYVQSGYVTGENATAFVDGQVRIARDLAGGDRFRLSAGGGAWGGAQEGSGRMDIGPSVSATVGTGALNARVSADYRFRVAGEAVPKDGPTLTISASF